MNRRGFLASIAGAAIGTAVAPAFVRFGSLMVPRRLAFEHTRHEIWRPDFEVKLQLFNPHPGAQERFFARAVRPFNWRGSWQRPDSESEEKT